MLELLIIHEAKTKADAQLFIRNVALSGAFESTRHEKGCIKHEYYVPVLRNRNTVYVHEIWDSEESHKAHMQMPYMQIEMELREYHLISTTVKKLSDFN